MFDTLTDVVRRIQPLAELLAAPRPAVDIDIPVAALRSLSQSNLGTENSEFNTSECVSTQCACTGELSS